MDSSNVSFFGVPVAEQGADEIASVWGSAAADLRMLIFADRMLAWRMARSRPFRRFLGETGSRMVPNGSGIRRQVRVATGHRPEPVVEFQAVIRIMAHAEQDGGTIYLLGRSPEQLQHMEQNVRATFPELRVVGRAVFHPSRGASIATAIRKASPRLVFVGTDARRPLAWVHEHVEELGPVTVLVAFRAAQRMAGRARAPRPAAWAALPLRPFIWPVLLGHRLRVRRRRKKRRV